MTSPRVGGEHRITRQEIEAKLREIRGTAEEELPTTPETAQRGGLAVGAAVLLVLAFWLGRRRGRKKSTIVEIRRI
jgi:LPXTG-motif cell wall-anchored protein